MTHEQILKKAIEKAVKNGLFIPQADNVLISNFARTYGKRTVYGWWTASVIFSHDFAKAFWGIEEIDLSLPPLLVASLPAWDYHLKIMVSEKDPVKYLEQFL